MMLNSVTPSTASAPAQQTGAVAAAQDASAPANAATAAGTATAAGNGAAAAPSATAAGSAANPAPAQAFAQWLGQQLDGAVPAQPAATLPAVPAQPDAAAPVAALPAAPAGAKAAHAAGSTADSDSDDASKTVAAAPDGSAMMAAMAMPLMPLSPQQITMALQAAAGNAPARADGAVRSAGNDAAPAAAVTGDTGQRAALALPQLAALQQPVQVQAQVQAPAQAPAAGASDAAATRVAVQAAAANDGSAGANTGSSSNNGGSGSDGAADRTATLASAAPVTASVPSAAPAQPAADTVKLAGPPTAWRQSLQEALGERLHVQVGNNIQQATISIEPPQLGRIDIAIRHSAGTLEVNISATNGDVVRQLQTVSDNLRNDLSQRQYTEVAVTVTPAPKNNAAPFGDPQQQGRGRQQERNQDNDPGRALAEAGNPSSRFSLGGRES